jgi:hypothetical protein
LELGWRLGWGLLGFGLLGLGLAPLGDRDEIVVPCGFGSRSELHSLGVDKVLLTSVENERR